MDLGERLQSVRKRRGVTQRELVERSGVSLSYVRKIEQGERDDARIETLRRLAVALACPLTALIGPGRDRAGFCRGRRDVAGDANRADVGAGAGQSTEVSERGLEAVLADATRLYHDNRYEKLALLLPRLIEDGNAAAVRHAVTEFAALVTPSRVYPRGYQWPAIEMGKA
jgi:transcriptional regulator with XRE-family HTH domain